MKLLLIGDTHGQIDLINEWVDEATDQGYEPDFVLQAGDFGLFDAGQWPHYKKLKRFFKKPTIVIAGNHEAPLEYRVAKSKEIPNFKLVGYPYEFFTLTQEDETIQILGVGGAKCVDDPPEHLKMPFNELYYLSALADWKDRGQPPVDLLLTHEAPNQTGMLGSPFIARLFGADMYNVGEKNLRVLWKSLCPPLQVNGHHHKLWEYEEDRCKHLTLPLAEHGAALYDTVTQTYRLMAFS